MAILIQMVNSLRKETNCLVPIVLLIKLSPTNYYLRVERQQRVQSQIDSLFGIIYRFFCSILHIDGMVNMNNFGLNFFFIFFTHSIALNLFRSHCESDKYHPIAILIYFLSFLLLLFYSVLRFFVFAAK